MCASVRNTHRQMKGEGSRRKTDKEWERLSCHMCGGIGVNLSEDRMLSGAIGQACLTDHILLCVFFPHSLVWFSLFGLLFSGMLQLLSSSNTG